MAKLVHTKCPNCGAAIDVDPSATTATCTYCGQSSHLARKTMFGKAVVPLNLAATSAKVIHVPNPKRLIIFPIIGLAFTIGLSVFIFMVVKQATDKATEAANPARALKSGNVTIKMNQGKTVVTMENGKVVGGTVNGIPIPTPNTTPTIPKTPSTGLDLYTQPLLIKAKFLGALGGDPKATELLIYRDKAILEVLDGSDLVRYYLRNGEVAAPHRRRASKSRLRRLKKRTFSLAKLSMSPVAKVIAATKAKLTGSAKEVTHIMVERDRRRSLAWRVYSRSSDDRKILTFDARGNPK